MGRAGRVAPRICSTLELRTHAVSSLTVSLHTTAKEVAQEQPLSPASPGTPGQVAPASVRPMLQAWPQDALQVVQRQMEALSEASTPTTTTTTRKRELEDEDGQGLEVLLQTQPALPTDWEQFLDLKTGQFFYLHWSSCKRAKQNPRALVRQADQTVEAHLREAHIRGESHIELAATTSPSDVDSDDDESEADEEGCSSAPDVCERTSGVCSVAPERCADRELGNDVGAVCQKLEEEQATNVVVCDDGKSAPQAVMVVSGCHSCSMFVMLCLSSPACPSCGACAVR